MTSTYRTTCDYCGGNNNVVWNIDGHSYCYNCGARKGISSLPPKILKRSKHIPEIRNFYKEMSLIYHSMLGREQRMFLYSRGISDKSINDLKIGFCPDEMLLQYQSRIALEAGLAWADKQVITLSGRVTFPFWVEGEVTDLWGRSLDPNEEIRYKGPFRAAYIRGADHMFMHDYSHKSKYRVITEGLVKAVVSNQYGICCSGYPGTTSARSGTPPMVKQRQIIVYDNQVNHRRELLAAIKKEAVKYGTDAYIGTLPLRGRKKVDIDTFILQDGIEEYKRVLQTAVPFQDWLKLIK